MYRYKLSNIRVVDGDTIKCDIALGFNVILSSQTIRLKGIDCGEIHSKDLTEKAYGIKAKQYVEELCKDTQLILTSSGYDKFGRILGSIELPDGKTIESLLLDNNYAVTYAGENKEVIKEKHIKNKEILNII